MEQAPYSHLSKGSLLIASPDIDAGIYFRSVVVVCEHSTAGSFGLIINKSLDMELPEEIFSTKEIQNPHIEIRMGGPIQPNQMMLLHNSEMIPDQTLTLCDGVHLGGDLQFLQEAMLDSKGPCIRICFGYAGWGASQLEKEFLSGGWFLHPGSAKYIFETPPEKIWQTLLRDMGGKYATLSMIPDDLSLN
ncbi:MAG: YqgE/AlgH family protein [Chlamydiales bacterium]|nr:YqgE/AlgH family protein [Chlamydiales bacterium]